MIVCHARKLNGPEVIVLTYMCMTALDQTNDRGQTPGLYWAGVEPLALALGYDGLTSNARQAVNRATMGLKAKGLISPMVKARAGSRQSWRLNVGPTSNTDDVLLSNTHHVSHSDTPDVFHSNTRHVSPRTNSRTNEDLSKDISTSSVTELQTAREPRKTKLR